MSTGERGCSVLLAAAPAVAACTPALPHARPVHVRCRATAGRQSCAACRCWV